MATQAEAIAHREALADVITLAMAELVTEWPSLPLDSPEAARVALAGLLGDLLDAFHPVAGGLGADWYDDLRLAANVPGSFTAPLPDLPPVQQIEKTASWAASGLYVDVDKALADSAAAVERLLALADREAIETPVGALRQPQRLRVLRPQCHPRPRLPQRRHRGVEVPQSLPMHRRAGLVDERLRRGPVRRRLA